MDPVCAKPAVISDKQHYVCSKNTTVQCVGYMLNLKDIFYI